MIQIQNVSKTYQELVAVKNINLTVNKSEIFGIIGYSGAGKSTLIRMLNLLETPSSGNIIINGLDLTSASPAKLRLARQQIGMVFQHFNLLWSRTVFDNIAFALEIAGVSKKDIQARVLELISLVGLTGREHAYPSQLSGGQKQRVGIARALANNPSVLLCDEATSALDPQTTDEILELLLEINQKYQLTIVLITHEMPVIQKIAHRVAVMDAGEIIETGSVYDIFTNPHHLVTKRFIKQVVNDDESHEAVLQLLRNYPDGKMLLVTFSKEKASRPFISDLVRRFSVDINIVHGKIVQTQVGEIGSLYIHLTGHQIEEALRYMRKIGLEFEVISA